MLATAWVCFRVEDFVKSGLHFRAIVRKPSTGCDTTELNRRQGSETYNGAVDMGPGQKCSGEWRHSFVRAVLSVYDKSGLDEFAQGLVDLGFELVSTGGTHTHLAQLGLPVRGVSDVTGFPEILEGRVKTLHPAIHGGLLRDYDPRHRAALADQNIEPITLLAVNLYPFEATVNRPGCTHDEALEQIDIGGPAMIRAAAKNYPHVIVVTNPEPISRSARGAPARWHYGRHAQVACCRCVSACFPV